MNPLLHIDLLDHAALVQQRKDANGQPVLFDPVRRKYIKPEPEEWVRQLWIQYLVQVAQIPVKWIAVERMLLVEGMRKRFDLVVFNKDTKPFLLAEFKSPEILLDQSVFDQVAVYNMKLEVPYALVSNGHTHYCFRIDTDNGKYVFEDELPVMTH